MVLPSERILFSTLREMDDVYDILDLIVVISVVTNTKIPSNVKRSLRPRYSGWKTCYNVKRPLPAASVCLFHLCGVYFVYKQCCRVQRVTGNQERFCGWWCVWTAKPIIPTKWSSEFFVNIKRKSRFWEITIKIGEKVREKTKFKSRTTMKTIWKCRNAI